MARACKTCDLRERCSIKGVIDPCQLWKNSAKDIELREIIQEIDRCDATFISWEIEFLVSMLRVNDFTEAQEAKIIEIYRRYL